MRPLVTATPVHRATGRPLLRISHLGAKRSAVTRRCRHRVPIRPAVMALVTPRVTSSVPPLSLATVTREDQHLLIVLWRMHLVTTADLSPDGRRAIQAWLIEEALRAEGHDGCPKGRFSLEVERL
jgi:hypothetical protein